MTVRWTIVLLVWMLGSEGAPATAQVSFKERPGRIEVEIAGRPFTALHYGGDWPKPFLHPLRSISGLVVTRGFPLEKLPGESTDHHWHRGLWFAHGDVNGIDFWRETSGDKAADARLPLPVGRIVARSAPKTRSRHGAGTIEAEFDLTAPGQKAIGTLRQEYTFQRSGDNTTVDVRVAIVADRDVPLRMGDTEEGLLGLRFADEFRQDRGATLSSSEGLQGTERIWGKRARWVDYSTTLKGEKVGVVIFDHPSNPKHPTYWHARGYGLNAANPFGERDFHRDKSRDGSLTIPKRGRLSFRYRIVIHPGGVESVGVEQLFAAFAGGRPAARP